MCQSLSKRKVKIAPKLMNMNSSMYSFSFMKFIKNQHEKLIEKSENPDIIQRRDATIAIRAINP